MTGERDFIASEITELESLLAEIPEDQVIDRMSLEARLRSAREALAQFPAAVASTARLTFRGRPVFGSRGIAADFGGKAASAFTDAFAAIAAALDGGLQAMGPIPNRDQNQLLITGTAIGSFGFEFQLPEPDLLPDTAPGSEAMAKTLALLRLTAEGSDDEVAELVEAIHPRAVRKVYEFMELLVQNRAWCGLEFGDQFFRFEGREQIEKASERLKDENIRESNEEFDGEFQGVLPAGRSFEFRTAAEGEVIRGKIAPTFGDPDVINREWLHKRVTASFAVIQVGQGRPRYTLESPDDFKV